MKEEKETETIQQEEAALISDSSRHMSMPMTKQESASFVVVSEKRRCYSAQEKMELVRLSYLPGNSVSSVARQYGIAPSLLFRWRALERTGGLVAIASGENTVSAAKYAEALNEIKRLQRLLGEAAADNALLKDAVSFMKAKKWIAR